MPEWIVKLARRLLALESGYVYQFVLIKDKDGIHWSLVNTSKIERP